MTLAVLVTVVRAAAAAVEALMGVWPFLLALLALSAAGVAWRIARGLQHRRDDTKRLATLRITLAELDEMDNRQFEYALRDLLVREGWSARRVGGGGDQVADVIGDHTSVGRIVVQAKHTRVGAKVGSSVMYAMKGTAGPVHRADHAVVVTNGTFTRDAMAWGERHHVWWVDRDRLQEWAENGHTLDRLLKLPARTRRSLFRRAA
ncbi:restriction endonuclease [Streptomyces aculeolatus]